jgi:hypothetical protein
MVRDQRKSPLNEAVGQLLLKLRHEHSLNDARMAGILEVSKSYLRALYIGARYLPIYTAVGLVEQFNANSAAATGLLLLTNYLDARGKEDSERYDLSEIEARADRLKAIIPQYTKLLEWLIDTIIAHREGKEPPQALGHAVGLIEDQLFKEAEKASTAVRLNETQSRLHGYNISPVFEDLLDSVATNLALLPPNMTVQSFNLWEARNGSRIVRLRSYVDDLNRLNKEMSKFDWSSLINKNKPRLEMLVQAQEGPAIRAEEAAFRKQLLRQLRDPRIPSDQNLVDQVFIAPSGSFAGRCALGLLHDVANHCRPPAAEPKSTRDARIKTGRYLRFNNAWLYELQSDSPDPRDKRTHWVGFLGTYLPLDPASSYVVVMDRNDIAYWMKLLDDAWSAQSEVRKRHVR